MYVNNVKHYKVIITLVWASWAENYFIKRWILEKEKVSFILFVTSKKLNKHAKYMLITHHQRKYILLCALCYTFFRTGSVHSWMPPLSLSENNNEGHISLKLLPEFYRYTTHFFSCDSRIYIFIEDLAIAFGMWNECGNSKRLVFSLNDICVLFATNNNCKYILAFFSTLKCIFVRQKLSVKSVIIFIFDFIATT